MKDRERKYSIQKILGFIWLVFCSMIILANLDTDDNYSLTKTQLRLSGDEKNAGTGISEKQILEEFRLSLAGHLDKILIGKNYWQKIEGFMLRCQPKDGLEGKNLGVYLVSIETGEWYLPVLWEISMNDLKKLEPGDIRKCAKDAAQAIVFELKKLKLNKQKNQPETKKILVKESAHAPLFLS